MKKLIASKRMQSFLGDPSGMIGATILLVFIFAAFFAPYLAPMNPYDLTSVDQSQILRLAEDYPYRATEKSFQ